MARKQEKKSLDRKAGIPWNPDRGNSNGRCRPPSDEDLISALNHSLRRVILRRLHRTDRPLSPADLSRLVGVRVTNLSYHFNVLRQHRIVKVVDERPIRGAVEHFYESKVADNSLALEILRKTKAKDEGRG